MMELVRNKFYLGTFIVFLILLGFGSFFYETLLGFLMNVEIKDILSFIENFLKNN